MYAGNFFLSWIRVNMSVAIVCMVRSTPDNLTTAVTNNTCGADQDHSTSGEVMFRSLCSLLCTQRQDNTVLRFYPVCLCSPSRYALVTQEDTSYKQYTQAGVNQGALREWLTPFWRMLLPLSADLFLPKTHYSGMRALNLHAESKSAMHILPSVTILGLQFQVHSVISFRYMFQPALSSASLVQW